ncbi:hypothetical protein HS5_20060 [Acidianus sp. HS-5]|nr:hypothetical protein HS5_20060 [Acidianus sp. HS-5]
METLLKVFSDLSVKFVHIDPEDLPKISEVARKYKLDFEDSIHFYCSTKINAELVSND